MLSIMLALALSQAGGLCSLEERDAGLCRVDASISEDSVDVSGERREGGSRSERERGGDTDRRASDRGDDDGGSGGDARADECTALCDRMNYSVETLPEVTLTDVASFAPSVAPLAPEPAGVGIVGMPVNVVATASTHSQTGVLFDLPVTVRFRPVSFTFHYGDGTHRDATTGGSTWSALGLPQFSPTATSHAYSARGTYTVDADVHHEADVDFGTGWIPVSGTLAIAAGSTSVEIVEVHTALVERTCLEDPAGVGC